MSNIVFDGTSLQTTNIHTRQIAHESMDNREIQFERLGSRDGAKFVSSTFAPRMIKLTGVIIGSSMSDLESRIDNLKELLNRKEKNLDVDYAGGTRRYKASCRRYSIDRDFYNITFVKWEAEFIASDPPFGTSLDSATIEYSPYSGLGTWVTGAVFTGTYKPLPIIQITINAEVGLEQISFENVNTNERISVASVYSAADILIVNTQDYTVTINGVATNYNGVFPEFVQGGNDFRVSFTATSYTATMKLIYYPLYL